ncbi:MAG: hypothetical protein Q7K65_02285 [Candidatus Buchananbacteria bacterium]|nr:hypothetical protein [Candidatus Buchananbacteria bacterium]
MSDELNSLERAKLVIIDTDNFSDNEAWGIFLDLELSSVDDLNEIIGTVEKHRPAISATMAKILALNLNRD